MRFRARDTLLWLGLLAGAAFMGYPYLYMLGNSFKTRFEFAADKASVWPDRVWAKVGVNRPVAMPQGIGEPAGPKRRETAAVVALEEL